MSPRKPEPPIRILFVCLANLCRSPLAKVIAQLHLGPGVVAESAGVAPSPSRMPDEGLEMIRRLSGADASGHRPRFVLEFPLDAFDYIIGMDSSVFMRLSDMPEIPKDKLYGWEISDPCGLGIDAYERTAGQIERYLDQFLQNREMEKDSARRKT
jgi:protein-tyrosine-phosphatase